MRKRKTEPTIPGACSRKQIQRSYAICAQSLLPDSLGLLLCPQSRGLSFPTVLSPELHHRSIKSELLRGGYDLRVVEK